MKKGDIGLIAVLLIGAVVLIAYLWNGEEEYTGTTFAQITVDGKPYQTVELTHDLHEIEIQMNRGYNLIRIYDKGIQMLHADCPDQLCVHMGVIRKVGERVVCLPNRVLIEIIGESDKGDGVDAVVS